MVADGGPALRVRALGGLAIEVDGRDIAARMPVKAALLVVYLAEQGRPVHRSTLAGLLWSDVPEDRARARLRVTLTRARAVMGDRIEGDRTTIRLVGPTEIDAASVLDVDPERILATYRGPYLDGVDIGEADGDLFAEWVVERRRSLHDGAVRLLGAAAAAARERSDWSTVRSLTERVLSIEPWNERAHRETIRAVAALEGRAAGLAAYRMCAERLANDLGVEPEDETVALAETLRTGDPVAAAGAGDGADADAPDAAEAIVELIETAHAASAIGDHRAAIELLTTAISAMTEPPTAPARSPDEPDELDELRLTAIEDLIEQHVALGEHRLIAARAEMFAARHPTRERAWANLMLVRFHNGRQAEALDAYDALRHRLADEHGVEPGPVVRAALQRIVGRSRSAASDGHGDPLGFDPPLPAALDPAVAAEMVGRSEEIDRLDQVLSPVREGRPWCTFVEGEPGIGKTRLAVGLAERAADEGFAVLYGRSDEGLSVPYRAWREAFADLADHVPTHLARRHLERFGPSLRLLIPSLASGSAHRDVMEDPVDQQQLLFEATAAMLGQLAEQRPILLVLDDLQWAERSTLALLRQMVRRTDAPIAIVGLYRSTEVDATHPLRELVADALAAGRGDVVTLEGLGHDAHIDLVTQLTGSDDVDWVERVAADLAAETGGNPFYAASIVSSLVEGGGMHALGSSSMSDLVPATVQRVVGQRVRRLGASAAGLLDAASVFGREFDLDVLAEVAETGIDETLDHLERALAAGLVTEAPGGTDRFAFCHDLVHHTLSGELSATRRRRLHRAVADAIVTIHGPDVGDRVGEVAGHLVAADDPSTVRETIRRCVEAGRQAASRHAPQEAVTWFEQALERAERSAADTPDGDLAALLVDLGTQQRNAGDPVHRDTLIRAGGLAEAAGDTETLVAAALANSRGMNAHVWEIDDARIRLLEAALDAQDPDDSAARAELSASLANERWGAEHEQVSEQLYRQAIDMARGVGDPTTLARVLVRASRARNFKPPRAELTAAANELRDLVSADDVVDPLLLSNALTTVINTSLRLGLADDTFAAIDALNAAAERLPLPMFTGMAHLGSGLAAGLRGDIAAYEQEATDTYHHLVSIEDDEAVFIFEGQMFVVAYMRGELGGLLDFSLQVMNERPEVPLYRAAATLISVSAGQTDQARSLLDAELDAGIEPSVDMFQIQGLGMWAHAAATLGHERGCERLIEVLGGLTTETTGHLVQIGEPVDICLGRMASVLARWPDAERHFELALGLADDFGGRWMRSRTLAARAEMLMSRGGPGDADDALTAAAEAHRTAVDEGYGEVAAIASAVLDATRRRA